MSLASLLTKAIDLFYIPVVRKFVSQQIFRYGACGAANMTLDAVWYFIIYNFIVAKRFVDLGFVVISPHILSLIIVFPITFFTGFWLNRNVAFRTTHIESRKQLLRYLLTVLGSILINYASMKLLVEHAHLWATPSKIITTVVSTVYSYLASRYFAFATKR
ncbi:MAG: GtrA family protein [Alistipes sp.]|nr:GtrA family protein [Alistipes sp.]